MLSGLFEFDRLKSFFLDNSALAGLPFSVWFFYRGYRCFKDGAQTQAYMRIAIALFLSLADAISGFVFKMWFGAGTAFTLFVVQIFLLSRWFQADSHST
jgi:hypothetical protein